MELLDVRKIRRMKRMDFLGQCNKLMFNSVFYFLFLFWPISCYHLLASRSQTPALQIHWPNKSISEKFQSFFTL